MKYLEVGGVRVSAIGLGTWQFGSTEWGYGAEYNRVEAGKIVRRALELGVNLIDTAESYGPHVSEELIAEALFPYPTGLVIATKGGFDRPGPDRWEVNCRPERLREELDGSLRRSQERLLGKVDRGL